MGSSVLRLVIGIIALVLGLLIAITATFGIAVGSRSTLFIVGIVTIVGLVIAGTGGWTIWNAIE